MDFRPSPYRFIRRVCQRPALHFVTSKEARSGTISTSDANDPMAIISMLFLFVKQLAFIVARSLKTAQEGVVTDAQSFFRAFPPTLPGVPPCAESATGGAHGGT